MAHTVFTFSLPPWRHGFVLLYATVVFFKILYRPRGHEFSTVSLLTVISVRGVGVEYIAITDENINRRDFPETTVNTPRFVRRRRNDVRKRNELSRYCLRGNRRRSCNRCEYPVGVCETLFGTPSRRGAKNLGEDVCPSGFPLKTVTR